MPKFKVPKHNNLDGQTIEYAGQKYVLTQTGGMNYPIDRIPGINASAYGSVRATTDARGNLTIMATPVNTTPPKVTLNPTMRFDTDANGQLVLLINPNPTIDYGGRYGDTPITCVPYKPEKK